MLVAGGESFAFTWKFESSIFSLSEELIFVHYPRRHLRVSWFSLDWKQSFNTIISDWSFLFFWRLCSYMHHTHAGFLRCLHTKYWDVGRVITHDAQRFAGAGRHLCGKKNDTDLVCAAWWLWALVKQLTVTQVGSGALFLFSHGTTLLLLLHLSKVMRQKELPCRLTEGVLCSVILQQKRLTMWLHFPSMWFCDHWRSGRGNTFVFWDNISRCCYL